MFDQSPSTTVTRAVPGVAIVDANNPERKNFHYIDNIYDPDVHPASDKEKYVVPNEGELVFDVPNGRIYFVNYVDIQAGYKTYLTPWALQTETSDTTEQDEIFGVRGGPLAGEAILAIDYSVRPNVARVDATIMRPGAAYAELYLGNDISSNGTIISAIYDKSNNKIDNRVPVELAEIVDRTNVNIFTTGQFSVALNAEALTDGKRCTLVFKDEADNFIPPAQPVMVQHSAYMRDHNIGIKTITEIELISPWFTNTSDPERMIVPINTPVVGIEWRAKVHYNNGDSVELPVNGTKFSLLGLNRYRPEYPGQEAELVLTYQMSDDEQPDLAMPGSPRHISRTYTLMAGAVEGSYTPRLFVWPEWDTVTGGWVLKQYLYDLDRKVRVDVTGKVTYNDQSPPFKPNSYGVQQTLIFNLNLRDVDPKYESVVFRQYVNITLFKDVNGPGKRWSVQYTATKPAYESVEAVVKNNGTKSTFNLTAGAADQRAWLDKLYWAIDPSYNNKTEEKAPTPTAFDIMNQAGARWRYQLADWNKTNNIPIELAKGHTYYICWVAVDATGNEQQLAMTGFVSTPS